MERTVSSPNAQGRAFSVHRSAFTVRRSAFSVQRAQGQTPEKIETLRRTPNVSPPMDMLRELFYNPDHDVRQRIEPRF
jgi:hypothetical protein